MTFDQIRTFLWVVHPGGFRKAAQRLHLFKPAITTRSLNEVMLGAIPYCLTMLLMALVLIAFPNIALFLPHALQ